IEGTELVIDTGPEGTTVDVIEGAVAMSNAAGATSVTGGTSGFAAPNRGVEASSKDVLGSLASAHRFPPIIAGELPLPNAVPTDSEAASADFHVRRAARRLDVGAIPEAEQDLATALALEPGHGDALALQALIALAQKRRDDAAALVDEALRTAPESAAPWLARSYVLPDSDPQALESAETAARVEPGNAFAWARIGELRLVNDNYRGGRAAAEQAAQLDPSLAHAHTVLGFAELTGGPTRAAEAAFRQAVRVDPADPLARLGLGLALYRQRDTDAARKETEIAIAIDTARSTLRGYVGKIYDEEGRSVGGTVLAIAKALNEEDPTGYYYDELRKQHDNRLGDAFLDFTRSFEQTGRRSVHGAQLALDEDLLARSAGVGRLHSALGFDRRGLLAAWRAMMNDPTEYSAHRVAADLYAYRPGRQLARVNEVHQAILRQPLNVTPIQAQLGEVRPYVHDQAG